MDDETLQRLVRAHAVSVPATRSACPPPEVLESVAATPRGDAAQLTVIEHVATCASCRRDFDLFRTAIAAAPVSRRVAVPRWAPALAAAALIAVVSLVALRASDDVVRGDDTTGSDVVLLPPGRTVDSVVLSWRAVPQAVSYRAEVTNRSGIVSFSIVTSDTVVMTPARSDSGMRWSVEATLLSGATITSRDIPLEPPH